MMVAVSACRKKAKESSRYTRHLGRNCLFLKHPCGYDDTDSFSNSTDNPSDEAGNNPTSRTLSLWQKGMVYAGWSSNALFACISLISGVLFFFFFFFWSAFPKGHLLRCYNIPPHYFPMAMSRLQCWKVGAKELIRREVLKKKEAVGPLGGINTDGS